MCFHCESIYRTKFDNITNRNRDGDKDRETQTVTETVRDRRRQILAEIDRYRNRQK